MADSKFLVMLRSRQRNVIMVVFIESISLKFVPAECGDDDSLGISSLTKANKDRINKLFMSF